MKCRRCGKEEVVFQRQICSICLKEWIMERVKIYEKADELVGKLCPENKEVWMDRVEELRKEEERA